MRCNQKVLRLFLLWPNGSHHSHEQPVEANSNFTHFCDHVHVLIWNFIMDLKRDQSKHQILCQTWDIDSRDPWNASASLQQWSNGPGEMFWVAFMLQKEQKLTRGREVMVTLTKYKPRKCWNLTHWVRLSTLEFYCNSIRCLRENTWHKQRDL